MSARNIQLMKWTFPALALIVGLFWYKRRRIDRVDPGGESKNTDIIKNKVEINREIDGNSSKINLYDSGIHIDESFTTSLHTLDPSSPISKVNVRAPRKVSESLDIPMKRSNQSQPISIKSEKTSYNNKNAWYKDDEKLITKKSVVLGSNPKSSSFDAMIRNRGSPALLQNINDDEYIKKEKLTAVNNNNEVQTQSLSIDAEITSEKPSTDGVSIDETKSQGQTMSERDSANHSPVSGVLDGSVNDEIRSEGSTDSGKGGSINGKVSKISKITYEFEIPQMLVGKFIGKRGSNIQTFNSKANVSIVVHRHPAENNVKLCTIEGSTEAINLALELIRQKFPLKKYPELTLEQINTTTNPVEIPWITDLMELHLIEGVNNDVVVCHILQPDRIFIQMPTHPTYPTLRLLDYNMTHFYNTEESPAVPDQLTKGMLVVAKCYDKWVRAYVEEADPNGLENIVRLVDHGGFWTFSNADMRKIRSDYLTLPFQAIEVSLANIKPVGGEWQAEAYEVLRQICAGSIGQAQIEGYIDSSVFVSLYVNVPKHGVISVAHELIARGYAEPVTLEDMVGQYQILQDV
ncbi:hypothetical protein PV327_007852 [Microctonus hyperodae]|uniref:K Homology domain-containing protein n=1 Tax=Microctonus hyperodae TaxID=165561 RepID=A0AA39G028_MICHY|nr:hypothetical protein PV327_007852 [Microctonus hyperodae]